jgi:uncharacterized protein (TIGR00725 family)
MSSIRLVGVVGSGDCDGETAAVAEEVGRLLAEAGFGVVCGGLGGVMEAACRGALRAGGVTVGILPSSDPKSANPFVQVSIPSGMGEARNALVVRAAEALIAIGGGYGTLSEIALALKSGKPVVGLGTWRLEGPNPMRHGVMEASSAAAAVSLALEKTGSPGAV